MQPVILLMGPTASGKTGLALELARKLPIEIISVDSAQVYRGMDIGTAKPDARQRAQVPHHLLDILDPADPYSAARFRADALRLIDDIRARGRRPLLVGGTMLYFQALLKGLSELPPASPELRARLSNQARVAGWPAMHARLAQVDPESAARLHPNDSQRVQRALEINELTGAPATRTRDVTGTAGLPWPVIKLALNPPDRKVLHQRIAQRFQQMMDAGFLSEVAALRGRGDLHTGLPSMRAVGYRQIWDHLEGAYDLTAAVARGIAATRQFAKRQLTWLRAETDLHLLDPGQPDLAGCALERIHARRV